GDDHAAAREGLYGRADRPRCRLVCRAAGAAQMSGAAAHAPRRKFLRAIGAVGAAALLGGSASARGATRLGRVVVVGGGYGGATAAKYLAMWGEGAVDVTLVESDAAFVSCPLSNLVVGGSKGMADITVPYDGLGRRG